MSRKPFIALTALSLSLLLLQGCATSSLASAAAKAGSSALGSLATRAVTETAGHVAGELTQSALQSGLSSSGAAAGAAQALPAALPALANPATLGVMGATGALNEYQQQKNREGFRKLQSVQDPEAMKRMILERYNAKYHTHYRTFEELQTAVAAQQKEK